MLILSLMLLSSFTNLGSGSNLYSTVRFADLNESRSLMLTEDEFTQAWSQFDIDSRMGKKGSSKDELFEFIAEQVLEWSEEEISLIKEMLKQIDMAIAEQKLILDLPDEILFLKTSGKEEGGAAAYTRGNYIIFNEHVLSSDPDGIKHLIVHELFHVLSRDDADFRNELYAMIGFKTMNKVNYPLLLRSKRITNPDAPQTDSYIRLTYKDDPVDCMMILYSDRDYSGGRFFEYLQIGFLKLKPTAEGMEVDMDAGECIVYKLDEVEGFFENVGKNTQYIIHPEELMAENFSLTLLKKEGLPNPEIPERIRKFLQEK